MTRNEHTDDRAEVELDVLAHSAFAELRADLDARPTPPFVAPTARPAWKTTGMYVAPIAAAAAIAGALLVARGDQTVKVAPDTTPADSAPAGDITCEPMVELPEGFVGQGSYGAGTFTDAANDAVLLRSPRGTVVALATISTDTARTIEDSSSQSPGAANGPTSTVLERGATSMVAVSRSGLTSQERDQLLEMSSPAATPPDRWVARGRLSTAAVAMISSFEGTDACTTSFRNRNALISVNAAPTGGDVLTDLAEIVGGEVDRASTGNAILPLPENTQFIENYPMARVLTQPEPGALVLVDGVEGTGPEISTYMTTVLTDVARSVRMPHADPTVLLDRQELVSDAELAPMMSVSKLRFIGDTALDGRRTLSVKLLLSDDGGAAVTSPLDLARQVAGVSFTKAGSKESMYVAVHKAGDTAADAQVTAMGGTRYQSGGLEFDGNNYIWVAGRLPDLSAPVAVSETGVLPIG
jgi:hypothetical protein